MGARERRGQRLRRERDVRRVIVGNDLSPSDWRARMLGVERAELYRLFHEGVMADPAELAAVGTPLREILRGASSVRVRHPNGTDITVASPAVPSSCSTTAPPCVHRARRAARTSSTSPGCPPARSR